MRIAVFSDSHGSYREMVRIVETGNHDIVIHLGDCVGDGAELARRTNKPLLSVAGNCDFITDQRRELVTDICGVKAFLCHGNAYGGDAYAVAKAARERGCTLAFFGHTHVPVDITADGVRVINPGSISRPRYPARCPSFVAGTISNGKIELSVVESDY